MVNKENIYNRNIEINKRNSKQWIKKLKDITEIHGCLSIYSDVKLDALESVGGYLYIYSDVKLDAPKLESVGGDLSIHSDVKLDAPKLESVGGDLSIYSDVKLDALESVGGDLSIHSDVKLDALESVGGYLYIHSDVKLDAPKLESVGGYLSIYSDVKLDAPKLESVGGYLYIYSEIDSNLEKRLWKHNSKNRWIMTQHCSEWLLSRKNNGDITYKINNVTFNKILFNKVRKDKLTAKQVFLIKNIEQRRIAYEMMDKVKMKQLKGKILDTVEKDSYGHPMKIMEIKLKGIRNPSRYLNCFDPSTGREYLLETKQETCEEARACSFGFKDVDILIFDKEW